MMDEKTIDLLIERLIRRIEQANTYYLTKIGSSIKEIRKLKPSEAHKLVQILKYGGNYEEIIRKLSKYTELNEKELDNIFSSYAKQDQLFYKNFYEKKNVPFVPYDENNILKMHTQALASLTMNEMYNYTRDNVLGYMIRNNEGVPTFTGLRETYNRVLEDALLNVSEGKETFDTAMTSILKDIGDSGLRTLEYESGRAIRLDSAVRMHLSDSLRQLHNENQKIIGEEFGADGVEVMVHSNPAPDHADVQGRQFSTVGENGEISEWEKLNTLGYARDYKGKLIDIRTTSKKGNVSFRPISTMNCYHYTYSIVLGISTPNYSEKELNQIKRRNEKGFEYEGKHYTMYEGTQLQRMLERRIREQKDIQILAKESDNEKLILKSQNKISILTRKYNELSNASNLPIKRDRLRVSGYRRTKVSNNLTKNNTSNESFNRNNFKQYKIEAPYQDYPKYAKDFDFPSNKYLEDYIKQGSLIFERIKNEKDYREQMYNDAKKIDELKKPLKENIVLFSGQDITKDLSKSDFVISTSIGEQTAYGYVHYVYKGENTMDIIKIYAEKGANVISTLNANEDHFRKQGEIIIPISEIKNLKKLNNKEYILKKK